MLCGVQLAMASVMGRLAHRHIGDRLLPAFGIPAFGIGGVAAPGQFVFLPDIAFRGMAALEGLGFFFKIGFFPILAHGVAVKAFPQQNTPQIGMPVKLDAIEVVDFAFLQVGAWINAGGGRHRLALRHTDMQAIGPPPFFVL